MKKKLQKSMLRVASKDEEAFRETLGAFETFYRIGLRPNDLSVAMVPRDRVCSPAIVVTQGSNAMATPPRGRELSLKPTTSSITRKARLSPALTSSHLASGSCAYEASVRACWGR